MTDTGTITRELYIEAEPATIFAYLIDPEKMMRWMGVSCEIEPSPGGIYRVDVHGGNMARGEFREVTPNSRLIYSFGWEAAPWGVTPGSSEIQIDLRPSEGGTILNFEHRGLPEEAVAAHTEGWTHYLGRLAIAGAGGDPGPDPKIAASRAEAG